MNVSLKDVDLRAQREAFYHSGKMGQSSWLVQRTRVVLHPSIQPYFVLVVAVLARLISHRLVLLMAPLHAFGGRRWVCAGIMLVMQLAARNLSPLWRWRQPAA